MFSVHDMQFVSDKILCVFVDPGDTLPVNHALRALRAEAGLKNASLRVAHHVRENYAARKLPVSDLNSEVHSGAVSFAQLDDMAGGLTRTTLVGGIGLAAVQMFKCETFIDWPMAVSLQNMALSSGAVSSSRRAMLNMFGRTCWAEPSRKMWRK